MTTPFVPNTPPSELEVPFSSLEYRQHQMFPRLSDAEIDSVRRFAQPMSFPQGEKVFETETIAPGLYVLLRGRVRIESRKSFGRSTLIVEHDDGHFMAEMAQLSGKPALIDGVALTDIDTLVIEPDKLRALIVADAQLGEHIMRVLILRRLGLIEQGLGPIIVGEGTDARSIRLQGFLRRNAHPATLVDARTDPEAVALLAGITTGSGDFPLVFCPNGYVLRAPDEAQLASCLGLVPAFEPSHIYDVAIVGAGPAGLAASVYATTEGLSVAVFDQRAPGGQAGASARIENYLGFPTGISGQALAARAFQQALKFGAHLAIPGAVQCVERDEDIFVLTLIDGQRVSARTVVAASGALYRKPEVPGYERFEGRGTYYWASAIEGRLVMRVLIRGDDLYKRMSRYLIDRIGSLPNVTLCPRCALTAIDGDAAGLTHVRVQRLNDDEAAEEIIATRHLFLFIGADPETGWLGMSGVELDARGFIKTHFDRGAREASERFALETSVPGMFAVGDVRSESAKRVASAVGDGAAVVSQIHAYLNCMVEHDAPARLRHG